MQETQPADYLSKIGQLCPDLTITHIEEIGDGFVANVFIVNHERVCRFVTNPSYSWVSDASRNRRTS